MTRQAVDVAAEARTIPQHTVEPPQMSAHQAHYKAHIHHRKKRTYAHYIPLPRTEKQIAQRHTNDNERDIHAYLHLREFHPRHTADGNWEALARHRNRPATHLQGNTRGKDRATSHLRQHLLRNAQTDKPRGECHIQIDERAEHETHQQLEQLHRLKPPPQHQYLPQHKQRVHPIGILANGEIPNDAFVARRLHNVWNDGYDTRPQLRAHAHSHTKRHHIQ